MSSMPWHAATARDRSVLNIASQRLKNMMVIVDVCRELGMHDVDPQNALCLHRKRSTLPWCHSSGVEHCSLQNKYSIAKIMLCLSIA